MNFIPEKLKKLLTHNILNRLSTKKKAPKKEAFF
tara:strand:- start:270 stop:371 length:102 start_codon:yes stop_codon:yes gene_type:complete